jgi:hypothetical protein
MKLITYILSFLLAIQPVLVFANKSTPLKKGQKAPFDGTLLDLEAIARILADKKINKLKCDLILSTELAKHKAKSTLNLNSCKISLSSEKAKLRDLLIIKDNEIKRLAKLAYKPKRDLTILWFSIGVAIGVGTTIGIAFAVKEATK